MSPAFNTLGWRVLALFCAVLLWFYATLNKKYETTVTIPIRLVNLDENLTAATPYPQAARVTVAGTGRQLFMLRFSEAELLLNAERTVRGINVFRLSNENVEIRGNPGVKVVAVREPLSLAVHFDAIVRKEVPVRPDVNVVTGQDRLVVGEPLLVPPRVFITGPRSSVAQVETLFTHHTEVNRLAHDTVLDVPLLKPEPFGVAMAPDSVRITIRAEAIRKRTFSGIPVRLIDAPAGGGAKLDVKTVSLIIAGAEKEVDAVRPENINVYVSYARFALEQEEEVEPSVSILGNVQWSNLTPRTARLVKK